MGTAAMPTQEGQEPGAVSMSGGWTMAIGSGSKNPDVAKRSRIRTRPEPDTTT